jgi:hypothetical protein
MPTAQTTGHAIASNLHACQIISDRDVERVAKQIDARISVLRPEDDPDGPSGDDRPKGANWWKK